MDTGAWPDQLILIPRLAFSSGARRLLLQNIYNRIQLADFARKTYTGIESLLVLQDGGPERLAGSEAPAPV